MDHRISVVKEIDKAPGLGFDERLANLANEGAPRSLALMTLLASSLIGFADKTLGEGEEFLPVMHVVKKNGHHVVAMLVELFRPSVTTKERNAALREWLAEIDAEVYVLSSEATTVTIKVPKGKGRAKMDVIFSEEDFPEGERVDNDVLITKGEGLDGKAIMIVNVINPCVGHRHIEQIPVHGGKIEKTPEDIMAGGSDQFGEYLLTTAASGLN